MASGGVTPQGVRDGDPATLAALCEARGAAVVGFCAAACGPQAAPRAAAEAFARFRAAVAAAQDTAAVEPERLLLQGTRHAAAALVAGLVPEPGALRRRGRACGQVPTLLAARAEDDLGPADRDRLAHHLERCPSCAEIDERFRRAERAYRSPSDEPLDPEVRAIVVAALAAAAPVRTAPQPIAAPPPDAPPPREAVVSPVAPPPDDAVHPREPVAAHRTGDEPARFRLSSP